MGGRLKSAASALYSIPNFSGARLAIFVLGYRVQSFSSTMGSMVQVRHVRRTRLTRRPSPGKNNQGMSRTMHKR